MSDMNEQIIKEFRENGGKVGGFFEDISLLLLHTSGAKSGKERINPLATIEHGDMLVIIASKGGADTNPDWYHNIVANPAVAVEYGTERFQVMASITSEPERTELYDKMASSYPGFDEYRKKTTRIIPVLTLSRIN